MYSASNSLTGVYRKLLEPLGLTYTQFIVLMVLWEKDGISISELADRTGLSNATMTPLLKRMEQKGFITRKRLSDNERQKTIVLTKVGSELSKKSVDVTVEAFKSTSLSKKQAEDVIAICQQIVRSTS